MKIGIEGRTKGSYILLIEIPRDLRIKIGALGMLEFPQGSYAYVGSAMGGLGARVNRHLRREKRVRWHVDYLLEKGTVKKVVYAPTNKRLECRLAHGLTEAFRSFPGFGSSDCCCPSHLFFSDDSHALEKKAVENFRGLLEGAALVVEGC
jgi:Uri superfamily endonuclease